MAEIILGCDEVLAQWAEQRVPELGSFARPLVAIGAQDCSGQIMAVAIYNEYRGHDISISLVTDTPRWATKGTIRAFLAYPFLQLGCARITAFQRKTHKRARKLVEGLGFKLEGVHPYAAPDGIGRGVTYGLYRDVAMERWLNG